MMLLLMMIFSAAIAHVSTPGGEDILTFYNGCPYRLATVFGLAHSYGFSRIMSSYRWPGGPTR